MVGFWKGLTDEQRRTALAYRGPENFGSHEFKIKESAVAQLLERFCLSDGMVELSYPSPMTDDDLKDFEDTLALVIRRLRRPLAAQVAGTEKPSIAAP